MASTKRHAKVVPVAAADAVAAVAIAASAQPAQRLR